MILKNENIEEEKIFPFVIFYNLFFKFQLLLCFLFLIIPHLRKLSMLYPEWELGWNMVFHKQGKKVINALPTLGVGVKYFLPQARYNSYQCFTYEWELQWWWNERLICITCFSNKHTALKTDRLEIGIVEWHAYP